MTRRLMKRSRTPWVVVAAAAMVAAGCSSGSSSTSGAASDTRAGTVGRGPGGSSALIGWDCPGGVCDWAGTESVSGPKSDSAGPAKTTSGGVNQTTRAPATLPTVSTVLTTSTAVLPVTSTRPGSASSPVPGSTNRDGYNRSSALPVTPGTIDDNQQWDAYLLYRQLFDTLGIPTAKIAVEGRQIVTVLDPAGHPVLGADVTVRDSSGAPVAHLVTHSDGRVLIHPPASAGALRAFVSREGATAEVTLPPAVHEFTVTLAPVVLPSAVKVDVLLLVDATASMREELGQLQKNIDGLVAKIVLSPSKPDVRFALTVYRDRDPHELFDTRTFGFTSDVGQFASALGEVRAAGGGDTPEDLVGGLHAALVKPGWRGDDTMKLLFLISDAPPHLDAGPEASYSQDAADANALGVKVMAIGANGLDLQGEFLLRQLAQVTQGRFVFLTSGADGSTPTQTPHSVTPDGLSALPPDELIARLVTDELSTSVR